jgi:hypothetical protein
MSSSTGRRAGLLIPLFSCPSTASWGIGDIGDVEPLTAWLAGAGQRILQLLPLNEMAPGQQSPYSALSAMAIDPIFIAPSAVPEIEALGGEALLNDDERATLAESVVEGWFSNAVARCYSVPGSRSFRIRARGPEHLAPWPHWATESVSSFNGTVWNQLTSEPDRIAVAIWRGSCTVFSRNPDMNGGQGFDR